MTDPAASPRLEPLPPSEWSAPLRLLLALSPGGTRRPMAIFATFARHPSLFWPWLAFAGKLLAGTLSARHREIAILRTAHRCGCAYEQRHHRGIARAAGLRDDELDAIERDPAEAHWSAEDRLVLEVVDELHVDHRLSDATWAKMRRQFSDKQLIEVVMLVGHYHLVAFTLNALRVEVEPDPGEEGESSSGVIRAIQRALLHGKAGRGTGD